MTQTDSDSSLFNLQQKTLEIVRTLSDSCRLCLQKQMHESFVSIFQQKDEDSPQYSILAMSFAKLQISDQDNYPKVICQKCVEKLQLFHEFRKKCELSQLRLIAVISLGDAIKHETAEQCVEPVDCIDNAVENDTYSMPSPRDSPSHDSFFDVKDENPIIEKNTNHPKKILAKVKKVRRSVAGDGRPKFKRIVRNRIARSVDGMQKISQTIILSGEDVPVMGENSDDKQEARKAYSRLKRFQCEECGQTYSRKTDLRQHAHQHTGIKPYSCDICRNFFTRKAHLAAHMLIHNSIKPFTCDLCGNSFRKLSNMARHKEHIHTSAYNFSCEICGRAFKRGSGVRHHMRVHTGARPYKCKDCPNTYTSHSGLRKHKRLHVKVESEIVKIETQVNV